MVETSKFANCNMQGKNNQRKNSSWYDLNLKLCLGTLASGLGSSNMSELFSFLGLPKAKTFHKRLFPICEFRIGASLRKIACEAMKEGRTLEVKEQLKVDGREYNDWLNNEKEQVKLTVSFDMGWNKRSSGNRYDSLSGHAFYIGCLTQQIICAIVTAKQCRICSLNELKGIEPPEHNCPRNYLGSSKGMEPDAGLTIYEELFYDSHKKIALQYIVSDDDSSMRALLKHSTNHSKGKLKAEIPEPEWLADPSHRTKVVAKPFFALANAPKSQSLCTKVDAIRVKKCYGYMIKNNCNKTIDEIKVASKAVIEHLFNNHEYCDSRWCRPKKLIETNKKKEVSQS